MTGKGWYYGEIAKGLRKNAAQHYRGLRLRGQKTTGFRSDRQRKGKIEEILSVFQDYIDRHRFFDIFYSKKFGYIRWDTDGIFKQFHTADDVMRCIISEIYMDVRELKLEGEHMYIYMSAVEEAE